ncbi:MAG: Hpt domain-containing protein [Ancalomicrobiaceae bacterium]|nr:Hpt domain-containing protein [Ancalomicrobiaceae bacterium]
MSAAANLPKSMSDTPAAPGLRRRPIDLVHLARQTHGNRELETEILALFLRQSPQQFARIAAATTPEARFEAAHQLKGSARAIGAWTVADWAERLEAGPLPDPAPNDDRLAGLEHALVVANDFIRALSD